MEGGEYNREFYSNIFESMPDKYYMIQETKMKIILGMIERQRNGKVLDIGCGDGKISSLIRESTGMDVHGVDISETAVERANKRGIKAKPMDVDKGNLPFSNGSFDAVFCGDLIEHIYDTEKLLDDIRRVLKGDGYVVLSTPNIASWYNRFFLLMGLMPVWVESSLERYTGNPFIKQGVGHIHAFTKRSLRELLSYKGFSVEKTSGSPVLADGTRSRWKEKIWNKADSLFAKRTSLSSILIVKARKRK